MNGKVKFFNDSKGFGFVTADDGKDYFVHITALPEGMKLNENDDVTFDIEQGDRGPKAVNVQMGSGSSDDAPAEEASEDAEEPAVEEESEEAAEEEAA